MKAVVFCALLGLVLAVAKPVFKEEEYQVLFSKWMSQHNKKYETKDFFHRFNVFKANLDFVYKHNQQGNSYTVGINAFGDMTNAEFSTRNGYIARNRSFLRSLNEAPVAGTAVPKSIDWRSKNAVTPVKNQGQCGSCWSFSTTGSVEGAVAIASKQNPVGLSEQQLMDCSTAEGNQGCNGGLMDQAFEYIIKNKASNGLCSEAEYPYQGVDSQCAAYGICKGNKGIAAISSYKDVKPDDTQALMEAVALGPVSIAIEADSMAFQFYSSGVLDNKSCGTNLDHGVLIVGYDNSGSAESSWIVKNSWGADWGMNGYINICMSNDAKAGVSNGCKDLGSQGAAGMCGILSDPSYPIV